MHKLTVDDNVPEVVFEENLAWKEISPAFRVNILTMLKMESASQHLKFSESLWDVLERRIYNLATCVSLNSRRFDLSPWRSILCS